VGKPWQNFFEGFIHVPNEVVEEVHAFDWTEFLIMAGNSVGIALIGITVASLMYLQRKLTPQTIAEKFPLVSFSLNKWYIDNLYDRVLCSGLSSSRTANYGSGFSRYRWGGEFNRFSYSCQW
jgi:NAD(P)H-quinone oxidoreductase subunit 5